MTIEQRIYDTSTLLGVMRKFEPVPNYWLSLGFGSSINFDDEFIDFSQITENRKIAPLVVPTTQGRPIYSQAEKVFRIKPAYVKPKDVVSGAGMIRRKAGLGELLLPSALSPQQRYMATVAEIMRQHREAIERRWEWMAAAALLDGKVTLKDEAYPETVVDFGRAAGHTVIKGGGTRWGDAGVSIIKDIEDWSQIVADAKFGGFVNRITVGTKVWDVMRADSEIKELLRTDLRQTSGTEFDLGPRSGQRVQFMGRLNRNLDVYVYSDYYEDENGATVPLMDSRDVVLTSPSIMGVRCYGAIQDIQAQFAAVPVFPKMWNENDPSATLIMTQSAPLMVPVNPDATFRARVIA